MSLILLDWQAVVLVAPPCPATASRQQELFIFCGCQREEEMPLSVWTQEEPDIDVGVIIVAPQC